MPELVYSIDKIQSENEGLLIIKIEEANKDGFSYAFVEKERSLYASTLEKLKSPQDSLALAFLQQEELKYIKKKTGRTPAEPVPFNCIHIPYTQTAQALKLLAGTGKLFFNRRQLVADLYTEVEFYFLVDVKSDKQQSVSGHLKTTKNDFNLRDCDFICAGPPHWFIKGIVLQTITTDISWNLLKQAYANPEVLTLEKIKDALPDDPDDSTIPKIVYAGNSVNILENNNNPLPVLMLKDRTGAFADLSMDYGDNQRVALHSPAQEIKRRNRVAELNWEKDLLETDFISKIVSTSHYYCPLDKVAKSLSFLLEIGWQIIDWKGNRVVHQSGTQLSLSSQQETILVQGKVKYEAHDADLSDVIGAFNRRERFVQLGSGVVGLLPNSLEQIGVANIAEEGEIVGNGVKVPRNRMGALDSLFENPSLSVDATLADLRERLKSFQGLMHVSPSTTFCGELRPYQQEGVNWLAFLYEYGFHGMLADDMGLGKTVQVIAFLSRLTLEAPVLIVLPTSLLFNWQREFERFLPSCNVHLHHGPLRSKSKQDIPTQGVILTSYTTLRLDLPILSQIHYQCVILDEAQAIKNPQTQVTQAVLKLQSRFRLSITGTPIENSLTELWSHFRFLIPDLLDSEKEFAGEIQASASDVRYLQRIKSKIRPFLLRRKKEEVAKDLPERIEQVVWVEMGVNQRKVYDDFLAGVRGNLFKKVDLEGVSRHRMEIFEAILRLRQICCHPLLASAQSEELAEDSAKMDALLEDIETAVAEGRKVLVYSQFTSMLGLIAKAITVKGYRYVYLDGSTVDREKVVKQFQEDATIPLFLISLKAGGIGLNLTAADYVFLYDPWWNEAVENQAINRAHRIGRRDVVIAKRYVAVETIEEKMMKLKAAKRSLVEDVLESDMAVPNLTEDDFRFLFS
jgi:superfamily II DNA or RNA helicase